MNDDSKKRNYIFWLRFRCRWSPHSPTQAVMLRSLIKKLRRLLQHKRHFKMELCISLSVSRLFYDDHVVQNRWGALSLAWHECRALTQRQRVQDLLLWICVVVRTSNLNISRRCLPDYVKTLQQKAYPTCSTIIFPYATNEIVGLWCCRSRCRFLNSVPIYNS